MTKLSIVTLMLISIPPQSFAGVAEFNAAQGDYFMTRAYCNQDGSEASSPFEKVRLKNDVLLAYAKSSDVVPEEVFDLSQIVSNSSLNLGDIADGTSRSGEMRLKVSKNRKMDVSRGLRSFYLRLDFYSRSTCGFGATSLIFEAQ